MGVEACGVEFHCLGVGGGGGGGKMVGRRIMERGREMSFFFERERERE